MQEGFFDRHSVFLGTSSTGASAARLNKRYTVLIEDQADLIRGASVLDIASHDGRWSYALLSGGADRVVGIEPRPHLIGHSRDNLRALGVDSGRYEFIQGDVFHVLHQRPLPESLRVDVVYCLGFLYHTSRHMELLGLIHALEPSAIVMDTYVHQGQGLTVSLNREDVSQEGKAFQDLMTVDGHTMVGRPSLECLAFMLGHFGYGTRLLDWSGIVAGSAEGVEDYAEGRRVTMVATRD